MTLTRDTSAWEILKDRSGACRSLALILKDPIKKREFARKLLNDVNNGKDSDFAHLDAATENDAALADLFYRWASSSRRKIGHLLDYIRAVGLDGPFFSLNAFQPVKHLAPLAAFTNPFPSPTPATVSALASSAFSDPFQTLAAELAQEQRDTAKKEMLRDVVASATRPDVISVLTALNTQQGEMQKAGWEMLLDTCPPSPIISRLLVLLKQSARQPEFNAAHKCLDVLLRTDEFNAMSFDEFLNMLLRIGHTASASVAQTLLQQRGNASVDKAVNNAVAASNVFNLLGLLSDAKITFRRNMNANAASVAEALKEDGGVETAEQLLDLPDNFLFNCGLTMTGAIALKRLVTPKPPPAALAPASTTTSE
jgi:hypothetical protein